MKCKKCVKKNEEHDGEDEETFRENDASEKDAVKDESEKWHLFIGKTSEDKMGIFFSNFHTLGNVSF